jgi:hypothetical protein
MAFLPTAVFLEPSGHKKSPAGKAEQQPPLTWQYIYLTLRWLYEN